MDLVSRLTMYGWEHDVCTFWPSTQLTSELLLRKVADKRRLDGVVSGFSDIRRLTEGDPGISTCTAF